MLVWSCHASERVQVLKPKVFCYFIQTLQANKNGLFTAPVPKIVINPIPPKKDALSELCLNLGGLMSV